MVSNEERREVARRIRHLCNDGAFSRLFSTCLNCDKWLEAVYGDEDYCADKLRQFSDCLETKNALAARIADLIEPQPIDGNTSDGYHTFDELYHHRAVLFSVIVENFSTRAWKSKLHADGTMYEGMFIVGIETPDGQATYHYDVEPYWNLFRCKEVDRAPEWDGHTPEQAIERIGKLVDCETDRPTCHNAICFFDKFKCSECGCRLDVFMRHPLEGKPAMTVRGKPLSKAHYCPNCGAEVVSDDD